MDTKIIDLSLEDIIASVQSEDKAGYFVSDDVIASATRSVQW